MKDRKVVAIMAKSGCGKSSLINMLVEKFSEKFYNVKSFTTRKIREYDPSDADTHIFLSEELADDIINSCDENIVAMYNSPKGYRSFTTKNSFSLDKISIYTIDSKAFSEMKERVPTMKGIYLEVDEPTRMRRYVRREGSLEGYSKEDHLDKRHIPKHLDYKVINTTNKTIKQVLIEVLGYLIEEGVI